MNRAMTSRAEGLVVVPAFNEAATVGRVIDEVRRHAPSADILVVDDCSADGTRAAALKAGALILTHAINLGDGAARQTGFRYARSKRYRWVVTVDGDGQHDPRSIADIVGVLERGEADVVIGSRFMPGASGQTYRAPLDRRLGMMFFSHVASALIRQRVHDTTSGYRGMSERAIALFSTNWFPQTFPDADLIVITHRAGLRIAEIPAHFREDESGRSIHSGITPVYYVFKMCLSLFVTMLRRAPRWEEVEPHGS
ncbi:MAG: glycosyltransferase family 2 protein [Deltaproteobacteria bacterium]|nr:glycosyltransferase family 2 protein [Deltaproteobacteria bacterium]